VLTSAELEAAGKFFRYSPENEDHVAARSLPGVNAKGAFFTRGSGHNKLGGYTEIPDEYQEVMDRLLKKHAAAARAVPPAVIATQADATLGVVSLGGCDPAVREGVELLAAERGIKADYMRIRAFPFGEEVEAFLAAHDTIFVIEQNRDAQLRTLLTIETKVSKDKLRSLLVYGGFPLSSRHVVDGITQQLGVT
jgi:2-oxoglutarate ferredoxin oxidoreductase subunit alpha